MGTPFAVATRAQAHFLARVKEGAFHGFRSPMNLKVLNQRPSRDVRKLIEFYRAGLIEWLRNDMGRTEYFLTDAGRVALELREILGPDRDLTRPQARTLRQRYMSGIWPISSASATFSALARIGLQAMGELTEDGQRIAEVLRKYRVEL